MKFFKKICIILIILFLVIGFASVSKADDAIPNVEPELQTNENLISPLGNLLNKDTVKENVYLFSQEDIVIDYNIDGDAYIMCAGNVTLSSVVYGNVFVMAKSVTVSNTGYLSELYSLSQSLKVEGYIDSNIYSVCQTFAQTNSSIILRDLFLTAENVELNGSIQRDVNISCENLKLLENAFIHGNLNYSAPEEADISEGAKIDGKTYFDLEVEDTSVEVSYSIADRISDFIKSTLKYIALVLALYFLFKWLCPSAIPKTKELIKNKLGQVSVNSIVVLFVAPIASLILLFTGIFTPIAFIILTLYVLALILSTKFTVIALSQILTCKFDKWNVNQTLKEVLIICAIVLVYKLLKLIPVLGVLLTVAMGFIGLGIMVSLILPKKLAKAENKENK